MDHAEAHERIADLALEPAALSRLLRAPGSESEVGQAWGAENGTSLAELDAHVRGCAVCRADLDGWRQTYEGLGAATEPEPRVESGVRTDTSDRERTLSSLADERPISAPPELRARIEAAIAKDVVHGASAASRARRMPRFVVPRPRLSSVGGFGGTSPWRIALPLVAVLALAIGGLAVVRDQSTRLDAARAEAHALEAVATTLDRLLADPQHHVVALAAADGSPRGTLAWSPHDVVVMTAALQPPTAGHEYRCWVERGGVRTRVGTMWFAGDLAYWSGSLDEWATISFEGGGHFGVSLEPTAGASGSNAPVLLGTLPA